MSIVDEIIGRLKVTSASFDSTSKFLLMQLRGLGDEGDDNNAEAADKVPFLPQLGFAIKPVVASTLRALVLRYGPELWALKLWDKALQPTDLANGETRVYAVGSSGTVVRLFGDGHVEITAAAGDVVLNGGTAAVARSGDQVQVSFTALEIAQITAPPSGGPCSGGPITITGTITGAGAPHVKA